MADMCVIPAEAGIQSDFSLDSRLVLRSDSSTPCVAASQSREAYFAE